MRSFENYNPLVVSIYFLTVVGIAMFCMNFILLSISLIGAVLLFIMVGGENQSRSHIGFLLLFIVIALINPIVSHNGATVLFVVNDSPITLEAVIYGFVSAEMIMAVLYWFRSFSEIMTSDKLLYVFGKQSPKLALVLSMGLRYVPLFNRQAKKINSTQKALGLYKEDNIVDRFKGGMRVFSVLLTWALENGIVTADSMAARGYGTGRRSHYSIFTFSKGDLILLVLTLLLGLTTCIALAANALDISYYPKIEIAEASVTSAVGLTSYSVLAALPFIIELKERIKWKLLRSKI